MNFIRKTADLAARSVSIIDDPQFLSIFLQPGCPAAIWQRKAPAKVQRWLDDLEPELLPSCRAILPTNAVARTIAEVFDAAGLPTGPERDWLRDDIVSLAEMFMNLTAVRFVRLRLDIVTTNACRKFHVDAVSSRLVCTYRGTGTQYGYANGRSEPDHVFTVATGAPILLRGTLWPEQPPSGLLHRSPPIEGTGETRLVLVLDPLTEPADAI